jgi:hypothetical protein
MALKNRFDFVEAAILVGLSGQAEKIGAHLQMLIFEMESEERGKRGHFEEGGKEPPFSCTYLTLSNPISKPLKIME